MSRSKSEIIRRLRLGDLQKILRSRYGHTLPDDDAGREDLFEMLLPISLGPEGGRRMKNAIEVWAKWMSANEARQLIDQVNRTPIYDRKPKARELGDRLRVSYRERESLKLKTIKAFDMTDEQLKEQCKAKKRARDQRRRRAAGKKPHTASLAKYRPWEAEGISRRTWFRKRAKANGTKKRQKQECHGTKKRQVKLTYYRALFSATEKPERPKERASRRSRQRGRTARSLLGNDDARELQAHNSATGNGTADYIEGWASECVVEDPAATTCSAELLNSCRAWAKRHMNGATPLILEQDLLKIFTTKGCHSHKSRLGVMFSGVRLAPETNLKLQA